MKRLLAAVLGALLFVAAPVMAFDPARLFRSVRAITDAAGDRFCSSSSINETKHYWLTAAHCVWHGGYVNGEPIAVIMRDVVDDLAVFSTRSSHAPALGLSYTAPRVGDETMVVGFPYGNLDPLVTFGRVSQVNGRLCQESEEEQPYLCEPRRYLVTDATGAPGSSGSPILNKDGRMISIVTVGYGRTFGPNWGVPYQVLNSIVGHYFEKGSKNNGPENRQ